jgi:hypothetical protein
METWRIPPESSERPIEAVSPPIANQCPVVEPSQSIEAYAAPDEQTERGGRNRPSKLAPYNVDGEIRRRP